MCDHLSVVVRNFLRNFPAAVSTIATAAARVQRGAHVLRRPMRVSLCGRDPLMTKRLAGGGDVARRAHDA